MVVNALDNSTAWHSLSSAEALSRLASREEGLSSAEAAERLARFGPNQLQEAEKTSPWQLLFSQFQNVLVLILLGGAVISA
ncbi:MAG TPA: cation-transporting P-type ATPase, partial [Thermoanaerobaculia bacterium]|nr:cation-transporting P-type ATPase [Thermoanaerobaculia bacterium]